MSHLKQQIKKIKKEMLVMHSTVKKSEERKQENPWKVLVRQSAVVQSEQQTQEIGTGL